MKSELEISVDCLCKALVKDPGYYMSWQANIAMAFCDQYSKGEINKTPHELANDGAKAFLDLLTRNYEKTT